MAWRLVDTAALAAVVIRQHQKTRNLIMANQDKLNALADQLDKAKAEIVGAVDALKAQVDAGETLDFTRVDAAAQGLDDLNADPEPEPPIVTPEPPVETSADQTS